MSIAPDLALPAELAALLSSDHAPSAHVVRSWGSLARPPSVWTGGEDGIVVRWALEPASSSAVAPLLLPEACLMGHAGKPVVAVVPLAGRAADAYDCVVRCGGSLPALSHASPPHLSGDRVY